MFFRLENLFIIGLFYLGLVTSWTDIKYGKIRNRNLLNGIYFALVVNVLILMRDLLIADNLDLNFYKYYFINVFFVLIVSIGLWKINLFTAGDSKLFFVMSLLVPPNFVNISYIDIFYSMSFFINVFCILVFYFFFEIIKKIKFVEFKKSLKNTFVLKNILNLMLFVFSMDLIFEYFPKNIPNNFFISIGIIFFVYYLVDIFLGSEKTKFFVIIALFNVIINFEKLQTVFFWKNFFISVFSLLFLRFLLLRLGYFAFTKEVKIVDLKKGMKLASDFYCVRKTPSDFVVLSDKEMLKIVKRKNPVKNIYFNLKEDGFFDFLLSMKLKNKYKLINLDLNYQGGISQKDVQNFISGYKQKQLLFDNIRIFETMYFAPLIFVGFLFTILVRGSIFVFFRSLL